MAAQQTVSPLYLIERDHAVGSCTIGTYLPADLRTAAKPLNLERHILQILNVRIYLPADLRTAAKPLNLERHLLQILNVRMHAVGSAMAAAKARLWS